MKFKPLSEEEAEAQSADLWPAGEYDFEVREATEKESKSSGADMIELELWLYNQAGGRRLVFDYLTHSDKSAWKLRSFAAACGLLDRYKTGIVMANEMVGRTGKCEIGIRKQEGYADKNTVRSYVKAAATGEQAQERVPGSSRIKFQGKVKWEAPAGDIEDDIPF
jgi:hypothetical protein